MSKSTDTCPICEQPAERAGASDYGDKEQFRCSRCGAFEISGSALAMLRRRLTEDGIARARLSHAIRSTTSKDEWKSLNSTNMPELLSTPLPGVAGQLKLLMRWLVSTLGEDHFGDVPIDAPANLAALVGALDGHRVERLLDFAETEGHIEYKSGKIRMTPKGWKEFESERAEPADSPPEIWHPEEVFVKAYCNECGPDRNAIQRASHTVRGSDGPVSWSDTYEVLECGGCSTLSVRHRFWFSEWDEIDHDPLTGDMRMVPGIRTTYWPPPTTRKKPLWADEIDDEVMREVFEEVYTALNAGLRLLSSIGTRTLLDRAMTLLVGDDGGFVRKLQLMLEQGFIGETEKDILDAMTDAGSASAHRGHKPSVEHLNTIIDTVENFIHRVFVLRTGAESVKAATPPRI